MPFRYLSEDGSFRWDQPPFLNELYFPLCNEAGAMSSLSPLWHGDFKTGQGRFLLEPVSIEDLHLSRAARNFWVHAEGRGAWSATGFSAPQLARRFSGNERRRVEAGPLWHRLVYEDPDFGLASEITSFAPAGPQAAEVSIVTLRNIGRQELSLTPTSVTPLFGRSAENLRDHRHVTSLIQRVRRIPEGLLAGPEIAFDEHGHRESRWVNLVAGFEENGALPRGSFGRVREFVGLDGTFDWPRAVVDNLDPADLVSRPLDGTECAGALRFGAFELKPGESRSWVLVSAVLEDAGAAGAALQPFRGLKPAEAALQACRDFWAAKAAGLSFQAGPEGFTPWSRWVGLQPILRRIFGCSFLPHHDYGKGGRGWRDLWQDCLSLLLQEPERAESLLLNNFRGVRADGTNATIIGLQPGEFLADRNAIARVWMDHGAWPFLTVRLYVDQTGDYAFLFKKEAYFKDRLSHRARNVDSAWATGEGTELKSAGGAAWHGTVLEHLLCQHLCAFFNVGEHNRLLLEGADWNDALDMARKRGESVAFSALYAGNLAELAELAEAAGRALGLAEVELFEELGSLLDRAQGPALDYGSVQAKRERLEAYCSSVAGRLSGRSLRLPLASLCADLRAKADWLRKAIAQEDWIAWQGQGFFRGYYNEDGQSVEGVFDGAPRFYLTSQVFPIMAGVASPAQAKAAYEACRQALKDPATGGYRLNLPLGPNRLNLGRGFAFAYGEKENGAVFCHMAIMFMNALYRRGLVEEGYEVFRSLFDMARDTERAAMYPGIPEYFNPEGRGLYHYLTGSGAWMNLTLLTRVFGLRGEGGDLLLEPCLVPEQYGDGGLARVRTRFRGLDLEVDIRNPGRLPWSQAKPQRFSMQGRSADRFLTPAGARLPASELSASAEGGRLRLQLELG